MIKNIKPKDVDVSFSYFEIKLLIIFYILQFHIINGEGADPGEFPHMTVWNFI